VTLFPPAVRRTIGICSAVLIFILLAGATYQGVATALERREFPRPGGMVNVGDHQLHIYCTGTGSPTVILEAPAAGLSAAWAQVQPKVASMTRVCSYDRAGLGWSEAGDRTFDGGRVSDELRTLLARADERGPFVVAGQGLGAAFARIFAARPDNAVAAVVLIDPPRADAAARSGEADWIVPMSPWLARAGVLRAGRMLSSKADGLENGRGALGAFLNRPDHLTQAAKELVAWNDVARRAAEAPIPAHTTIVTVDFGSPDRIAFLTDATAVDRVVRAIAEAVAATRTTTN